MSSPVEKVPEWLLERLAAGELPEEKVAELREKLGKEALEARMAQLASSNAEILSTYPADQVVATVERRAAARLAVTRRARPIFALSMAAATCAAGMLVFLATRRNQGGDTVLPKVEQPEIIFVKGEPSLRVHRKTKAGSELLDRSSVVRAGDTLQLGYVAAGKRFGVVASIDARGSVSLHLPESPGPAARLDRNGERALPHAFELDDSPGFERFVFVTSDKPFTTNEVSSSLKKERTWPRSLSVFELTLKKESR